MKGEEAEREEGAVDRKGAMREEQEADVESASGDVGGGGGRYPPASALLSRLKRGGHVVRKGLGQNFLVREGVLRRIAEMTEADERTLAVEVGPGPATLTTLLAERCGGVVAVERDESLRAFHAEVFGGAELVEVVYGDALRVDLQGLARERGEAWGLERRMLVGNLPFQITSPLLFGQCGADVPWERMVVMVQREVAERIAASPRTKDYGILTVKLAYWWEVGGKFGVPAEAFRPRPKVDAAVVRLEPKAEADRPGAEEWRGLSKFIDLAFQQRRKRLYNSPAAAWIGEGGRERLRAGLEAMGLNPDARPEELTPEQLRELLKLSD